MLNWTLWTAGLLASLPPKKRGQNKKYVMSFNFLKNQHGPIELNGVQHKKQAQTVFVDTYLTVIEYPAQSQYDYATRFYVNGLMLNMLIWMTIMGNQKFTCFHADLTRVPHRQNNNWSGNIKGLNLAKMNTTLLEQDLFYRLVPLCPWVRRRQETKSGGWSMTVWSERD